MYSCALILEIALAKVWMAGQGLALTITPRRANGQPKVPWRLTTSAHRRDGDVFGRWLGSHGSSSATGGRKCVPGQGEGPVGSIGLKSPVVYTHALFLREGTQKTQPGT